MTQYLWGIVLAIPMTLATTGLAFSIGAIGALPVVAALRSRHRTVRLLARLAIDLIRGIPPLVWLFVLYFGVSVGAFTFDPFGAAVVGLGVVSTAYLAEIYRAAIGAVHVGQWEAAEALSLDRLTTAFRIIGPQAVRVALPSMTTFAIGLLKDSSLASAIGVTEIVYETTNAARQTGDGLLLFCFAGFIYIALSVPLAAVSRLLDSRMRAVVAR